MTAPTWRRKRDGTGVAHAHVTPWALASLCGHGSLEFTAIDRDTRDRCVHCLAAIARNPMRRKKSRELIGS